MHTPTPPLPDRRPVARVDVVTVPRFGVFGRVRTYRCDRTIDTTDTYPIGCERLARNVAEQLALSHGYRLAGGVRP